MRNGGGHRQLAGAQRTDGRDESTVVRTTGTITTVASDISIRPAAGADLPAIIEALGQQHFFAERFRRQQDGRGVLLVAWLDGRPVGDVYVWLERAEEWQLREHLPGIPLLNHLEVVDGMRNRAIGTAIVEAAERLLAAQGFKQVALGIRLDNAGAARLYERLGYAEWEHGHIETSYVVFLADGQEDREPEMCRILVKDLRTDD